MHNKPLEKRILTYSADYPKSQVAIENSHDIQHLYTRFKLNELRLELATNAAEIGLWALDLETYVFWVNDKVRDIFCFPRMGEISFSRFLESIHPDDTHIIEDGMHRALQKGETPCIEYRILLPDGSIRWIQSRGALFSDDQEKFSSLMGVSIDLTERKLLEIKVSRQLQFETMLAEISASIVNCADHAEVNNQIETALSKLLDYFDGDRCGLIMFEMRNRKTLLTHAFYREGLAKVPPDTDFVPLYPWTIDSWVEGKCIYFTSLDELPPEAEIDRQSWASEGVASALLVPLPARDNITFLILIQSLNRSIEWPMQTIPRLQMIGEVFINAIYRSKAEMELIKSFDEIARLKEKLEVEADYLREEVRAKLTHDKIVGQSEAIKDVLCQVELVAPTSTTVLVCGETGTGKELIAQAIHSISPRRSKLMVKVNCASLPSSLMESELFGREKGAYTGALTRQIGRFELADESTLFLDEISELSFDLQAKLLRVLQEGEFERLGSPRTIKVNVRVIAATNRNLKEEMQNGRFREDLYYRLNVFPIQLPPLRQRQEDISMLVWEFLREFNEKMGKRIRSISKKDMALLQSYSWPGNIRELRNVLEHAVIISTGDELKLKLQLIGSDASSCQKSLKDVERSYIQNVLKQTEGRIKGKGGAAQILDMKAATLYSRMKKLGIPLPRDKDTI